MTASRSDKKLFLFSCLALALGTLALYWPLTKSPFTALDDIEYVIDNPMVNAGLSWHGIIWACTAVKPAYWHPLTWISHMLDCQLFGLNAGGHHLVNIFYHIANTLILFIFLRYTTGAQWRGAIVAALFAWHPLHVESVAWIAERKDVLCTFFWLLTMLAYARYVKSWQSETEHRAANASTATSVSTGRRFLFFALTFCFLAAALMSKPMAVTLPFVLLLLDYWPLNRVGLQVAEWRKWAWLVLEKIPLVALSLCSLGYFATHNSEAICPVAGISRIENIPVSYVRYLTKTFWPTDLSIFYPYVYDWPSAAIVGSILLLLVVSLLAALMIRQQKWLAVGWFWFLGTLVPVIGVVQAGMQSMADRFVYIPSIGLFVAMVWAGAELSIALPYRKKLLVLLTGGTLAACLAISAIQISYWQTNVRLFTHAVLTTQNNYVALNALGCAFNQAGERNNAITAFKESIRIGPNYWPSERNLALALLADHQSEEAFKHFDVVVSLLPNDTDLRYELAGYLRDDGKLEAAQAQLAAALKLKPAYPEAHNFLGAIFIQQSELDKAIHEFQEALKISPDFAEAHLNLGIIFVQQDKIAEAIPHFQQAVRLVPYDPETHHHLGVAFLGNHQPMKAEAEFATEQHLSPRSARAQFYLGEALQAEGKFTDAAAHYRAALTLAPDNKKCQTALDQLVAKHPEIKF